MKWAIVSFPGSNCEQDTHYVLKHLFDQDAEIVWHQSTGLESADVVVLPGGFAHGDYLRCGAIARFSPIMDAVREHVARGKLVLGICNGMQVLTEAGLLPGALLRNDSLQFRCEWVHLRIEVDDCRFLGETPVGSTLRMPISHGEGRYHCDPPDELNLARNKQILLRYSAEDGSLDAASNPNGSVGAIAGIRNREGTVFGLMPHPERCCDPLLGGIDGRVIFKSMIEAMHA